MRALPAVLAAAAALTLAGTGVALADTTPTPSPTPTPTVSVAQVCAATAVPAVDDALKQVAALLKQANLAAPLLTLDIPAVTAPTADAAVQTAAVRKKLNCDALAPTVSVTVSATVSEDPTAPKPWRTCKKLEADGVPTPILAGDPDYDLRNDSDKDGVACEANDFGSVKHVHRLPRGGVSTGWVGPNA